MDIDRIKEIFQQEDNITKTARRYAKEAGIGYDDSFRRKVSKHIHKNNIVDSDLENDTTTESIQYKTSGDFNMPSAWDTELQKFLTIEEYCDKYGLDKGSVKSSKLITHNQSNISYNIAFFTQEEEITIDLSKDLENIVQKHIKPYPVLASVEPLPNSWFDRLVYSDTHIAMDVQGKGGDPLYDGKWDKVEILKRLDKMIQHTIEFQKSDTLVIDDLGDFLDGLGGETTRKGHHLPQNMNDKEAFDLALEFKIRLVDNLVSHYSTIICNNITNDNHAGVFSYFASSAVKQILEQRYPNQVTVKSIKKFIDNYSIGKHTFVLTHGKDSGENKFGMKPKLDAVQAEKIDQYCKEHKLYNGNFIELSKGDSHQAIYDDTTSNDFCYYNYPAFSPPSNWVKTNFKLSKSGFRFYNIHKEENIKIAIPFWF